MVHFEFKTAVFSGLLAAIAVVGAASIPAPGTVTTGLAADYGSLLEKRDAVIARSVDPAIIEHVRDRVGRPKESPQSAQEKPKVGSDAGARRSFDTDKGKKAPANAPKTSSSGAGPRSDTGKKQRAPQPKPEQNQKPIKQNTGKPNKGTNLKGPRGGPLNNGGATPEASQPSKLRGGANTSGPNIQRGGNAPRVNNNQQPKGEKQQRKISKPKSKSGSDVAEAPEDDGNDLAGSERVAKDALEGAGKPRNGPGPSQEGKAQKKPNVNNRQGKKGKGYQALPSSGSEEEAPTAEAHSGTGEPEDDYFEWFNSSGQTPTKFAVKAKDGWKSKYKLQQAKKESEEPAPEGLEKLPSNVKQRETEQKEAEENNKSVVTKELEKEK